MTPTNRYLRSFSWFFLRIFARNLPKKYLFCWRRLDPTWVLNPGQYTIFYNISLPTYYMPWETPSVYLSTTIKMRLIYRYYYNLYIVYINTYTEVYTYVYIIHKHRLVQKCPAQTIFPCCFIFSFSNFHTVVRCIVAKYLVLEPIGNVTLLVQFIHTYKRIYIHKHIHL